MSTNMVSHVGLLVALLFSGTNDVHIAVYTVTAVKLTHPQPVREAISCRELFTAGWFGVREKHGFRLEIYDHLRASEPAPCNFLVRAL